MFKFISTKEQFLHERRKNERMEARQTNIELANSITFVTLAEKGDIDDVTATEHTDIFSPWVSGMLYSVGVMRQYNNELYRCIQAHTSQDDWAPNVAVSLWSKVGNPNEEYPEWSQPVGAHDSYNIGDKVSHNEKKWVSACNDNVWEPGIYGWDEV